MEKIVGVMNSVARAMSAANETMKSNKKPQLTIRDLQTLVVAAQDGHSGPRKLASLRGVSSAAMTGSIDALEKKGLITRQNAPHDRRVTPIRLTALGDKVIAAASDAI